VNYYHLLTLFPKNKTVSKTETKEKKFVVVPIQKGIQGIKPQYFVLFCLARRKKQGRKKACLDQRSGLSRNLDGNCSAHLSALLASKSGCSSSRSLGTSDFDSGGCGLAGQQALTALRELSDRNTRDG
jgi:hypothetical protein